MFRASNSIIGFINFLTFLISIPILGGGIWLSTKANTTDCIRFLQWPVIIISLIVMVVSLAGFAGACYRISWLLSVYLFVMFFVIAALIGFTVFAFVVTGQGGSGHRVLNRNYLDYRLSDWSGWLRERVVDSQYWNGIVSCIKQAGICRKIGRSYAESADTFYRRSLSPIESGCCKPPTDCGYTYVNETYWLPLDGSVLAEADCSRWSNDQTQLCYPCGSCRAGVLANLKDNWRKVSLINLIMVIVLVILYVVACAAFRNARRSDNDESYGVNRMTKSEPSRFYF